MLTDMPSTSLVSLPSMMSAHTITGLGTPIGMIHSSS